MVAATLYLIHPPTKGSLESSHFLTSSMYLCHFLTSVDSMKPFASGSRFPFCRHQHNFSEGRQYLDSHSPFNERSRTAQGETPLLPAVVGPHNIRHQHFLMLWWVLLCDYCSYFYHLPKTSELGRAINARIIADTYYRDHCLLFRVCSFAELSSAFFHHRPRGHCSCLHQHFSHLFFQSYMTRAWGMPTSFVHSFLFCAPHRRSGPTGSFFLQRIALNDPTIALSYNNILSRRNIDGFRLYVCS
jgi:hypothetical protein